MFCKLSCLEKNLKQKQMRQKVAFINAFHEGHFFGGILIFRML